VDPARDRTATSDGAGRAGTRSALWLPLFDELADPLTVARLAAELRGHDAAPYDVAVGLPLGIDPVPFAEAGATWWLPELAPDAVSVDAVRAVLRDGPMTQ
jgi:hypothetical protein